jgi:hypothetical protein
MVPLLLKLQGKRRLGLGPGGAEHRQGGGRYRLAIGVFVEDIQE